MQSCIFSGQVKHSRTVPVAHAFSYRLFMMYLDLDELSHVFHGRWFWSTKRPALARFRRENYLGDPAEPLAESVRKLVASRTGSTPNGPIRLLTNLSYFGYCFNPISVYYCFDRDDTRVEAIVAEVSNTPWGERHCYVLDGSTNLGDDRIHRYESRKELHVSPFMDMDIDYNWLLTAPSDNVVVRISNLARKDRIFAATLILRRKEINAASLAFTLAAYPFMTIKVILAIHWQALRLWLKGCRIKAHPAKHSPVQANR
ncbi:MAG: DUF1365 domain-containing protein [Gammaproteobacteria bacterium]|nr:DUF1365 domain-containing protein [Gammaproteobacteria bacterium]MDH4314873.1 DUF1365 domain-containing protein [Gammaproteobacteria bacterium]MDH5213785.1 DUF1365 domain-containing protein [Gammaproteobacteria bacterium]MDH5501360.1 DUF1365 domain-containing protein [Gammaproteobacteria bacterium]